MAGKRNAEGIALLSVYGDVDSDNELEDSPASSPIAAARGAPDASGSIVDYEHDETAGTPEHKEEKAGSAPEEATVNDMQADGGGLSEQVSASTGVQLPGTLSTASRHEEDGQTSSRQETVDNCGEVPSAEEDVLAEFWPSPPSTPCSDELQAKFAKYLKWKELGRSFNDDLRNSKGYRNPDFLQLAVIHQNIDEIGSCFNPDVFDPHSYDKSDYADALAAEQRKKEDRKEQERRQNQRTSVDFVRATQLLTSQKVSGLAAVATHSRLGEGGHTTITTTSLVHTSSTTSEVKTEARTNKKSKWDKAGHH